MHNREIRRQTIEMKRKIADYNERVDCHLRLVDERLDAVESGIKLLVQQMDELKARRMKSKSIKPTCFL